MATVGSLWTGLWGVLITAAVSGAHEAPTAGDWPSLGWLNRYELENIHYHIDIQGTPISEQSSGSNVPESQAQEDIVPIINKFGQRYHCRVPMMETPTTHQNTGLESGPNGPVVEIPPQDIHQLLTPLAKAPCLLRTKDWWTYEFCYGKSVRQFHMEDNRPSGKIMSLGQYDHDYEWKEGEGVAGLKHHSQFYLNGSACDLTGSLRQTEVRFICNSDAIVDAIVQVDEPVSCEYVLTVATSKICSFPQLKPPPVIEPQPIVCSPVLTEREYEKYLKFEEAQQKLQKKKALANAAKQKKKMLEVLKDEDLSGFDVDSEEGFAIMEEMVQMRMADKLASELKSMLTSPSSGSSFETLGQNGFTFKRIFADDLFDTSSKRVLVNKENYLALMKSVLAEKKSKRIFKDLNPEDASDSPAKMKFLTQSQDEHDQDQEYLDMERKIRSDFTTPEEMHQELDKVISTLDPEEQNKIRAFTNSEEFKKEIEASFKDIVEETEQEIGLKLNSEPNPVIEEYLSTVKDLMSKLDQTSNKINDMTEEITSLDEEVDEKEDEIDSLKVEDLDDLEMETFMQESLKRDNKRSVKKDLSRQFGEEPEDDALVPQEGEEERVDLGDEEPEPVKNIQIKVTDINPKQVSGLKGSPSSEKVAKRLESAIKDKLVKAGFDSGGRQIEVKLVTSAHILDDFSDESDSSQNNVPEDPESQQQFQNMLYNLMIGNHAGYDDIDSQRKSEKNYKFAWNDAEFMSTIEEPVDDLISSDTSMASSSSSSISSSDSPSD
ncbi:protein OS-9-like [Tigriopus californicus]|uniref:protein OS-9-like n=1 Tax=Tigriopus californicus TaxID=6832 RepID=UPI0027DA3B2E|nr:protein OS-9-like [Tigriopus californicus]|eukprot:TCALIF_04132-PA protein Name:"Similar to Os9 Protein OS-9 (Rattus norvegicus)" AED:0.03 eAED:0.03 QI:275/1/1/1/1/1/6/188/773